MLQCTGLGWFGALGSDGRPLSLMLDTVLGCSCPALRGFSPFVPVLVQVNVAVVQYQSSSKHQTSFQPGECLSPLKTRLRTRLSSSGWWFAHLGAWPAVQVAKLLLLLFCPSHWLLFVEGCSEQVLVAHCGSSTLCKFCFANCYSEKLHAKVTVW